jgi:hypothetical protein
MTGVRMAALAAAAATLTWVGGAHAEDAYVSPDGDFRVTFPAGEPTIASFPPETITGPDEGDPAKAAALGAAVRALHARYDAAVVFGVWKGARQFMVERMRPKPDRYATPPAPSCNESHSAVGAVTDCRVISYGGRTAVAGNVRIGASGSGSFRMLAQGGMLYVISYAWLGPFVAQAMDDREGPAPGEAERFFDSFRLNAPAPAGRS